MNQQQRWAEREGKMAAPAPRAAFSRGGRGWQRVLGEAAVGKQKWME